MDNSERRCDSKTVSLAGRWICTLDADREGTAGEWHLNPPDGTAVSLPGTTGTNRIGPPPDKLQISNLTPETDYVGPTWYRREFTISADDCAAHLELYLERCCWQTFVWLNGVSLGSQDSLVAPHIYDLTSAVRPGQNQLTVMVDNSNVASTAPVSKSDGSQCEDLVSEADSGKRLNCGGHHTLFGGYAWNGITGRMELQIRPKVRITNLQVYPDNEHKTACIRCICVNDFQTACQTSIKVTTTLLAGGETRGSVREYPALPVVCEPGETGVEHRFSLGEACHLWDEFTPDLYEVLVTLESGRGGDRCTTVFGMRTLSQVGTQLAINGRPTFLRGALEKFVHPLTGYPPTDLTTWLMIFGVSKKHGLNHIRFHTCCPPEAAFVAADRLGMILNVEIPGCSGGEPDDPATQTYLQGEALRILATFGNHPSFCMLTMGNELLENAEACAPLVRTLNERVARCREADERHWYCCSAQPHSEGRHDDFYVSAWPKGASWGHEGAPLTGIRWSGFCVVDSSRFNTHPPETKSDYRDGIRGIEKPLLTHEVGQWAVYPDVREIDRYTGVMKPYNLERIRDFMAEKGTLPLLDRFVRASGELSLLLYKEEIESALRTPGLAGFQLLGFHDHPPQGTSTIGIVNALRESKGITTPEQFRQFCGEIVPLARLEKRTFTNREVLTATIDLAHAGPERLKNAAFEWSLTLQSGEVVASGELPPLEVPRGSLSTLGRITVDLAGVTVPAKAVVKVFLPGTEITNSS